MPDKKLPTQTIWDNLSFLKS